MARRKAAGSGKATRGSTRQTKEEPAQVEKKKQTRQKVKTGSKVKDGKMSPVQEEEMELTQDEVVQNGSGRRRGRSAKLQAVKKMATMQEDVKTGDGNDDSDEDAASLDLKYDESDDDDEDEQDFEATLATRKRANTRQKTPSRGKVKSYDKIQQPGEILPAQVKPGTKKSEERYLCQASQEQFLSLSESDSSSEDEDIGVSSKSKQSLKPNSDQSETVKASVIAADSPKVIEKGNDPTGSSPKMPTDSVPKSLFDDLDDIPDLDNSQPGKDERCTRSLFDDVHQESDHEEGETDKTSKYFAKDKLKSPKLSSPKKKEMAKEKIKGVNAQVNVKSATPDESGHDVCLESDHEEGDTNVKPVAKSKYFAKDMLSVPKLNSPKKKEMAKEKNKGVDAQFNVKSASPDESGQEETDKSDFEESPPLKTAKKQVKKKPIRGTKDFTKTKEETKKEPNKKDDTNTSPVVSNKIGRIKSKSATSNTSSMQTEGKRKGEERAKKDDNNPTPSTSKKRSRVKSQSTISDPSMVKTESGRRREKGGQPDEKDVIESPAKKRKLSVRMKKLPADAVQKACRGKTKMKMEARGDADPEMEVDATIEEDAEKNKLSVKMKKLPADAVQKAGRGKTKVNMEAWRRGMEEDAEKSKLSVRMKKLPGDAVQKAGRGKTKVKMEARRGIEPEMEEDAEKSKLSVRMKKLPGDAVQKAGRGKTKVKMEARRGIEPEMEEDVEKRNHSVRMKKLPADAVQKAGRKKTMVKIEARRNADSEMEVDVKTEDGVDMSSDDSHSDWEEVEDTPMNALGEPMVTPTKKETKPEEISLEIDIDLPGTSQTGKKKKKEYNWANYFQWQVNKYNKERQLQLHKAHLVLLLASSFHSNNICNKMELQCLALSIIPSEILSKKPKLLNINYLTKVLSWFKNCFKIRSDLSEDMVSSLDRILPAMFERRKAASERELVHMFAIIMRCLGADVRLIFSLQPMTFKAKKLTKKFKKENASKAPVKMSPSQSSMPEQKTMQSKHSSSSRDISSPSKSVQSPSKAAINTPKPKASSSHAKTPSSNSRLMSSKLPSGKSSTFTPRKNSTSSNLKASPSRSSLSPIKSSSSKSSVASLKKGSTSSKTKTTSSKSVEMPSKASSSVPKTRPGVSTQKTNLSKASQLSSKSLPNKLSTTVSPTKTTSLNSKTPSSKAVSVRVQSKAQSGKTLKEQKTAPKKTPTHNVRNKANEKDREEKRQIHESARQTQKRALRAKNTTRRTKASKVTYTYEEEDEYDESDDDHSDYEEELRRSASKRKSRMPPSKKNTKMASSASSFEEVSSSSDFEEVKVMSVTKQPKKPEAKKEGTKKRVSRKMVSSDSEESVMLVDILDPGSDCWLEVYLSSEKRWMCVDCVRTLINKPEMCEKKATKPITYVIGVENDGCVKDITRRYASKWMTETHKLRPVEEWWEKTLKPYMSYKERDQKEDSDVQSNLTSKPLPTSVSEYKNHPLYALKRHLLKFESLYPESAAIIGYCRGEAVYSRECVHTLHTRETWMKEGKAIRIGEKPYKMVKPRPKWKKGVGMIKTEEAILGIFGAWQVEDYIPPPAVDGKVPRNEYGNVELFKPTMLPAGTVHLKIPGLNKVARKLNLDCAPAMTGWDFHSGFNHPVMDGFVVCEEHAEVLVAAWEEDRVEREKKEKEKREARAMDHWKLFIKSLLIRERLKERYGKNVPNSGSAGTSHQSEKDERKDTSPVKASWPENKMTAFTGDEGNLLPFEKKTKTKKKKR